MSDGPFATGTSYTGNSASHNYITGGGTALIKTESGEASLTEKDYGTGSVMLGGLTASDFWQSSEGAKKLRANMFARANENVEKSAPVSSEVLLQAGGAIDVRDEFSATDIEIKSGGSLSTSGSGLISSETLTTSSVTGTDIETAVDTLSFDNTGTGKVIVNDQDSLSISGSNSGGDASITTGLSLIHI